MHLTKGQCLVCEGDRVLTDKTGKKARKIIISLFFEDNLNIQELKKESCSVAVCPICYYQLELLRSTASCFKEKTQHGTCSLCSKCTDLVTLESSKYFETVAQDYKLTKENNLCSACLFYLHFRNTVKKNLLVKFPSLKLDESPKDENISPSSRKDNVLPSTRKEYVPPSARKENASPKNHEGKLDLRAIKKMKPLSENKFIKKLLNITDFKLSHQIPFVIVNTVDVSRKIINRPRIKIKFKKTKTNPLFKSRQKTENWNSTCVEDSLSISSDEQPEEGHKRKFDEIEDEDSGQTLLKKGVLKGQSATDDNCDAPKKKKKRVSFKEDTVEIIDDYTYNSSSEEPISKPLKNGEKPLENRRLSYELIVNLVNMKVSQQNNSVTKNQHSTSDISRDGQKTSDKTNVVNDKSSMVIDSDEDTVKLNSDSDVDKQAESDDDDAPLKRDSTSEMEALQIDDVDMVEPTDKAENSEDGSHEVEADNGINQPNEEQISNDKSDDNNETKTGRKSRRGTRKQASITGKGEDNVSVEDELSLSQSDQSFNDKPDDDIESKSSRKSRRSPRKASITTKAEENEPEENDLNLSQSNTDQSVNDNSIDNNESKNSRKSRRSVRKQAAIADKEEVNESDKNELNLDQSDKDQGSSDNNETKNSRNSRRNARKQTSVTDRGDNESDEDKPNLDKDQDSDGESAGNDDSQSDIGKSDANDGSEKNQSLDRGEDEADGKEGSPLDKGKLDGSGDSEKKRSFQQRVTRRASISCDREDEADGKEGSAPDKGKFDGSGDSEKNQSFRQRARRRESITCDREEDEADGKENPDSEKLRNIENEDTQEADIPGDSSKDIEEDDEATQSKVTCVESDSKTKTDEISSKDVESDEKRESEAPLEEEQDTDQDSGTKTQEDSFKGFSLRLDNTEADSETQPEKGDAEEEAACKSDENAGKSSDIIDLEDKDEATEIAAEMTKETEAKSKSTEHTDGLTETENELALIKNFMASEETEGDVEKENDRLNRLNSLEKEDLFSIIGLNDAEADDSIENNKVQKSLPENDSNVEQTSETVDGSEVVNEDGSKNEDKQNTHSESERKGEGDATDESEDILRISDLNAIID